MGAGDIKKATQGKGTEAQRPAKDGPLSDVQNGRKNVATGDELDHEGATEAQVGDRSGPGVGFDQEPEREKDEGGVS